ncbi:hypothetical protein [Actinocatenispora rupis]|uniref:hypothetical protein n=1 Tax=Actinocatenispora rupis TaxID=519421 RepID=UPI00194282BE|nr:hypothetical protein [Actinocatenispora rupis]
MLLAGALSAALLAGCKQSGDNNQAAGSARPSTSASPSASASPSGSPSAAGSPSASTGAPRRSAAPPTTKPGGDLETHTGTVTRGVEPGCTILKASDGNYELVGADATAKHALQPDARVVVRGYQEHGVMSHCMQGKMLKVVSAHAAN